MKIVTKISPNQNERANGQTPSVLILHYTGTKTAQEADEVYMTPDRVSPHYMIDRDATITRYVDEEKRSWHAGLSSWAGQKDINSTSIGIEVVNGGHEAGLPDFPDVQIAGLIELINDIRSRWAIADHDVLGHSDIAPGRKIDPGEKFPWTKLHQAGIGLMPRDGASWAGEIDTKIELFAALRQWGYDYTDNLDQMIHEFRRHYLSHTFDEAYDERKVYAAINSLIEQKKLTHP